MSVLIRYEVVERRRGLVKVKLYAASNRAWNRFHFMGMLKMTAKQFEQIKKGNCSAAERDPRDSHYIVPLAWLDPE